MDNIQHDLIRVIRGKKYNTGTATLIASRLSTGVGAHLYRTQKGAYFVAYSTIWQGEGDTMEALSIAEAQELYSHYTEEVDFEEAFPTVPVEVA